MIERMEDNTNCQRSKDLDEKMDHSTCSESRLLQEIQSDKSDDILTGLNNYGNTCYANTIIQMLYHAKLFRHITMRCFTKNCGFGVLRTIFMLMMLRESPKRHHIQELIQDFSLSYKQMDAYSFYLHILNKIEENRTFAELVNLFKLEQKIEIKSVNGCCQQRDSTMKLYAFELCPSKQYDSVQNSLDRMSSGQCLCKGQLEVRNRLVRTGKYLVFHINKGQPMKFTINKTISVNGYQYQLKGRVVHSGFSNESGHYVYVKHQNEDSNDVIFNDSKISHIVDSSLSQLHGSTKMLIYERQQAGYLGLSPEAIKLIRQGLEKPKEESKWQQIRQWLHNHFGIIIIGILYCLQRAFANYARNKGLQIAQNQLFLQSVFRRPR